MRFYILAILVILFDQASKIWIRFHFAVGEQMEVWPGILYLIRYENAGIAFSMLQGYGRLFVPIAVLVVAFILYYRSQLKTKGIIVDLGTALLVGGAIGNAIDRVLYNQVTDFIHFNWNHGILNLADYAINLGIILFLIDNFFLRRNRTKQHEGD
ncbi:signal peptidase II [Ammoniphilus resinae]|uniref:Lipoprotein signal peptidase n=1 Tax=Ammoniphilus resinae TaxID=861532 RepID=A0ABS4GRA6_9BACL|nr:signal peptidase II [Ammoniphilus resinae]